MEQDIDKLTRPEKINYIIYRYLMEQGYAHSAYTFGYESQVYQQNLGLITDIPPGLLVTLFQKGLQLTELQANAQESSNNGHSEFQHLSTNELLTKDLDELRKIVSNNRNSLKLKNDRDMTQVDDNKYTMELDSCIQQVMFSPKENYLLSGAQNGYVRVHDLTDGKDPKPITVRHTNKSSEYYKSVQGKQDRSGQTDYQHMGLDVTVLEWRHDGRMFASGGYDGNVRIWTKQGNLLYELAHHTNPVFCQKFNPSGTLICSGSIDKSCAIWNVDTGQLKQVYTNHTGSVVDLDWYNDDTVATSSTDRTVIIYKVGDNQPITVMRGHTSDVNMCRWSPNRSVLATASGDRTAKLWSIYQSTYVAELTGHTDEVEVVAWSPTGPGTEYPNLETRLATASHDNTVKIWDVEYAKAIYTLQPHHKFPSSLHYSPDGQYLISCEENAIHIWSTKDGQRVKTISNQDIIFQAVWNYDGSMIALATGNSIWIYPDFRI